MKFVLTAMFSMVFGLLHPQKPLVVKGNSTENSDVYYSPEELEENFSDLELDIFEINYQEAFSLFKNKGNELYRDYYPEWGLFVILPKP